MYKLPTPTKPCFSCNVRGNLQPFIHALLVSSPSGNLEGLSAVSLYGCSIVLLRLLVTSYLHAKDSLNDLGTPLADPKVKGGFPHCSCEDHWQPPVSNEVEPATKQRKRASEGPLYPIKGYSHGVKAPKRSCVTFTLCRGGDPYQLWG